MTLRSWSTASALIATFAKKSDLIANTGKKLLDEPRLLSIAERVEGFTSCHSVGYRDGHFFCIAQRGAFTVAVTRAAGAQSFVVQRDSFFFRGLVVSTRCHYGLVRVSIFTLVIVDQAGEWIGGSILSSLDAQYM